MNKRVAGLISIIVISTSLATVAHAVVKPGTSCPKLGAITLASGLKYTCVKSGKKFVWNKGAKVSNPAVTPSPTPTPTPVVTASPTALPTPASTPVAIQSSQSLGDSNIETCRITDQRPPGSSDGRIAYPARATGRYKNSGPTNIVVLPVDFSDAVGAGKPSTYYQPQLTKAADWVKRYSNGKASYNFITNDQWIRAKGPSKNYNVIHYDQGGTNVPENTARAIQEFINTAGNEYSYKDIAAIWVFYSPNQKEIIHSLDGQGGADLHAPDGSIMRNPRQFSTSVTVTNEDGAPLWGWFVHEMLHAHGLRGHSPIYPYMLGMMAQGGQGASSALNSWDQLILDWLPNDRLYCADLTDLADVTIPIIPRGSDADGIESAMVKISSHQMLVIELEKKSTWAPGLRKDFAGVMAYLVDTKIDTNLESMQTSNFGTTTGTANYLVMPGVSHGTYKTDGKNGPAYGAIVDGALYYHASIEWNQNLVLFAGEQTKLMGVNIGYKTSNGTDFLVLSK